MLSPPEEALLASAGEMAAQPDNIFSMLNDADLAFPDAVDSQGQKHPVTHGTFIPLLMEPDRALRITGLLLVALGLAIIWIV